MFLLTLLRMVIDKAPASSRRELRQIEEQLAYLAYDGEKFLLSGQAAFIPFAGWILIVVFLFMPLKDIARAVWDI